MCRLLLIFIPDHLTRDVLFVFASGRVLGVFTHAVHTWGLAVCGLIRLVIGLALILPLKLVSD